MLLVTGTLGLILAPICGIARDRSAFKNTYFKYLVITIFVFTLFLRRVHFYRHIYALDLPFKSLSSRIDHEL